MLSWRVDKAYDANYAAFFLILVHFNAVGAKAQLFGSAS